MRNSRMNLLSLCFVLVCSMGTSFHSYADGMLDEIKARADKIKQYKALLNTPDQVTRLAALDVMLKSDDIVMRNTAFTAAFNSDDEQIRALALKHRLSSIDNLTFKVENKKSETTLVVGITDFDLVSGKFGLKLSSRSEDASVYGTAVKGGDDYKGAFDLRLIDGGKLTGTMQVKGERFPVTAELL